jgi:hypothetical protein
MSALTSLLGSGNCPSDLRFVPLVALVAGLSICIGSTMMSISRSSQPYNRCSLQGEYKDK